MLPFLTSYLSLSQMGSNCRHSSVSVQKDRFSESLCRAEYRLMTYSKFKKNPHKVAHAFLNVIPESFFKFLTQLWLQLWAAAEGQQALTGASWDIVQWVEELDFSSFFKRIMLAGVYLLFLDCSDAFLKKKKNPVCDKSGPNLVIYSKPSYDRSSGHSPNRPTQNRQSSNTTNEKAGKGEENKELWEQLWKDTFEARLRACASNEFHNSWKCRAFERLTTEKRLRRLLHSVALNCCCKK